MLYHGSYKLLNRNAIYLKFWKKCLFHTLQTSICYKSANQGIGSHLTGGNLMKSATYRLSSSTFFTVPGVNSKRKEYNAKKIVGYSMEQMYSVVSDVENYKTFVPFCTKSNVYSRTEKEIVGELQIGFPPIIESYTSRVSLIRPRLVKAVCTDGRLFDHLVTTWSFNPGLKQHPQSCLIDFYVSFEFKSLLHSQLAHMFFNELVRQMESAFFREAQKRFGVPTINIIKIKSSDS